MRHQVKIRNGLNSNDRRIDYFLNRLFRRRWKKTPKLRVTGLCEGNSPVTGEFPDQRPVTRKMFPLDDATMKISVSPRPPSPFINMVQLWLRHGWVITRSIKCGLQLLIPSQIDEWFYRTLHNGCVYLSKLGLKLIHVIKPGPKR